MAEITIVENHSLPAAEAKERVLAFEEMMSKYGVRANWSGNDAKLKGMGVSGNMRVTDSEVRVVLKLGMMARAAGVDPKRLKASVQKRLHAGLHDDAS